MNHRISPHQKVGESAHVSPQQVDAFIALWSGCAHRIRAYLYSLVGNSCDLDDLHQQVSLIAWQKFSSFDSGTDFARWACRIAHLEVLEYFRKQKRSPQFHPGLLETLTGNTEQMLSQLDAQDEALKQCLQKLKTEDRDLISWRYRHDIPISTIATRLQRSDSAIYKAFHRIHEQLYQCVKRQMSGMVSQ